MHESDPTQSGEGLGLVWGSVLWPSGISLAKYFSYCSVSDTATATPIQSKKRILELGCGTGVVGLTLATKLQSNPHVTLTDSEPALYPILRKSIEANQIPDNQVRIHGLDWRDPSTFLMPQGGDKNQFDLVVAADVLYSSMDKLFARALAAHLPSPDESSESSTLEAIIACPFRTDSPLEGFVQASMRLGLGLERLENDQHQAVGAGLGVSAVEAFEGSQFVPLRRQILQVSTEPTFSLLNVNKVQIFRVRRVTGTAAHAASIRRVGRI